MGRSEFIQIYKRMSDTVSKYFENADSTLPIQKKDQIVEDVIAKYKQRSELGIKKYNTTLQDNPDGFYAFLNHLQEELMDATLYIQKLKKMQ